MFDLFFGLGLLAILGITTLILPWVNRSKIKQLRQELTILRRTLDAVQIALIEKGIEIPSIVTSAYRPKTHASPTPSAPPKTGADVAPEPPVASGKPQPGKPVAAAPVEQPFITEFRKKEKDRLNAEKKEGFERQFGAKLPVWIGGIALAFAGFYMVKYSIESGLLSPAVRVLLGGLFGIACIASGHWVRNRNTLSNTLKIAQALSGAGLAVLYASIFSASSLYQLISPVVAFVGMAAVTGMAVVLSLRHGAPIAMLGLIGGFITPALTKSSEPNVPLLFIYLFVVYLGVSVVIRKERWEWMKVPSLLGAFFWVILWLDSGSGEHFFWVGLFLLAVGTSTIYQSRGEEHDRKDPYSLTSFIHYLSLGGVFLLMAVTAHHSGLGLMEWAFFGLLSLGGIALAWFDYTKYGFVPWLAFALSVILMQAWETPDAMSLIIVLGGFFLLYFISSFWLMYRSERTVHWALLNAISAAGYYLLGYGKLPSHMPEILGQPAAELHIWGFLALGLSAVYVGLTRRALKHALTQPELQQRLLAIFALAATAFVAIGLTIELPGEFLSVALALEVLAVAWINLRVEIHALRYFAGVLTLCFLVVLLPQLAQLIGKSGIWVLEFIASRDQSLPIALHPLFQLGLPAIAFMSSARLLLAKRDDRLVQSGEVLSIALLSLTTYFIIHHAFLALKIPYDSGSLFAQRSVITLAFFLLGLSSLWAGRKTSRIAISYAGVALAAFALARTVYYECLRFNAWYNPIEVGDLPILNTLLLAFAIPAFLIHLLNRELAYLKRESWTKYTKPLMLFFAFAFVTLQVRQFFHGSVFREEAVSSAEIYSYSVAWILFGIVLLFFGTLKRDQMMRIASLGIILLSIGKVFLYDASELTGLYRVFSFLGLGVSLLGLSYFYTRFVFKEHRHQ